MKTINEILQLNRQQQQQQQLGNNVSELDELLVGRLQEQRSSGDAMRFLLHVFDQSLPLLSATATTTTTPIQSSLSSKQTSNQLQAEQAAKLVELATSYIGLMVQYPDMFTFSTAATDINNISSSSSSSSSSGQNEECLRILWMEHLAGGRDGFDGGQSLIVRLVERFDGDGLESIVDQLMGYFSFRLMAQQTFARMDMKLLQSLLNLLGSHRRIADIVTRLPAFNPTTTIVSSNNVQFTELAAEKRARWLQSNSLMGPWMDKTCFGVDDVQLAMQEFGNESLRGNRQHVVSVWQSWRMSLDAYHQLLHGVVLVLVKSNRQAVMDYFGAVLSCNGDRGKMHIRDPTAVSTEGFMLNLYAVLLLLSQPLMDAQYSKLHLIAGGEYLRSPAAKQRLAVNVPLTKLNVQTPAEEEQFYAGSDDIQQQSDGQQYNFVTELFYMTAAYAHFGLNRTILTYLEMAKDAKELQRRVQQLNEQLLDQQGGQNPRTQVNKVLLQRAKLQLEQLQAIVMTFEAVLRHREFMVQALQLQQLVMRYLLRAACLPSASASSGQQQIDPQQYGKGVEFSLRAHLPLQQHAPLSFSMLPEYFVEDAVEMMLQITRFNPELLLEVGPSLVNEMASFAVVFLMSRVPQAQQQQQEQRDVEVDGSAPADLTISQKHLLVKNPYLCAKMVEVLFSFTWKYGPGGSQLEQLCHGVFGTHPLLKRYLPLCLLSFYVEVEKTGMSSQFYDKFGIRYNCSQILKFVWTMYPSVYRTVVTQESVQRWDLFVKFVNLLMNDTTYLLDEGLGKLSEIHKLQVELQQQTDGSSSSSSTEPTTLQQHEERAKRLAELERGATSYIQLANETVHMLSYLTDTIVDPFLRPEIIDRLAAMLNFNLVQLVGSKCTELIVKNPEKYHFQPRVLLSEIVDIYLHLGSVAKTKRQEFVTAVARDGRSYSPQHFERAAQILSSKAVKTEYEVQQLMQFVQQCELIHAADKQQDADWGDVPEEFLDPLMYSLMEDPVILPSSRITVDRSTIQSHLLSDATDPFNRVPLSMDQVFPDNAMRQRIADWKKSKKAEAITKDK